MSDFVPMFQVFYCPSTKILNTEDLQIDCFIKQYFTFGT